MSGIITRTPVGDVYKSSAASNTFDWIIIRMRITIRHRRVDPRNVNNRNLNTMKNSKRKTNERATGLKMFSRCWRKSIRCCAPISFSFTFSMTYTMYSLPTLCTPTATLIGGHYIRHRQHWGRQPCKVCASFGSLDSVLCCSAVLCYRFSTQFLLNSRGTFAGVCCNFTASININS